jgi:precorrin-6B methylase 2
MDYQYFSSHRLMIRDTSRTEAFAKALKARVRPGDIVLDVGAGTGVLSLLAAQAGATRVYAVERTAPAAAMTAHLAQVNGASHVVKVIQADIRAVSLPEKVDLIVSEWMGSIGVDENLLGAVLWARDHCLKPGGIMIPQSVTAWAAPVETTQRADINFFANRPFGLDLSPLGEPFVNELLMIRRRIDPAGLAAAPQVLWKSEVATDPPASVREPYQADLRFVAATDTTVSALGAWFAAELAPGVTLSNAPDAPDTHWGQLMLPFDKQLKLRAEDTLEAAVEARAVGPGPLQFAWSARVNAGPWERHDTMGSPAAWSSAEAPQLPRSALSQFLARLSLDPALLGDFLADPDGVMSKHGLSEAHRKALKTRDPLKIQEALYQIEQNS